MNLILTKSRFFLLSLLFFPVLVLLLGPLESRHRSFALAVSALKGPQSHFVVFHQLGVLTLADLALHVFCDIFSEKVLNLFRLDYYLNG